jgi:hypothetical protein
MKKNINDCNKSGMNSFLAKPVSQDTIKNIITEFVNSGI